MPAVVLDLWLCPGRHCAVSLSQTKRAAAPLLKQRTRRPECRKMSCLRAVVSHGLVAACAGPYSPTPGSAESPMLDQMEVIRKPDVLIWRYMDLRYFEDMLRTNTLYCARLDRFNDQLEGTRTQRSFERGMKHWIARYAAEHSMDIESSFPSAFNVEDFSRSISRQAVFASC